MAKPLPGPIIVLHLVGSPTSGFHRELSELYARGCIAALGGDPRYRFVIAHVSPGGEWRFPSSLNSADIAAATPLALSAAVARLASMAIDVALPQMFCLAGMTQYRALLDLACITYVGNLPLPMALAADKAKTRAIVAAADVRVPNGEVLRRGDVPKLVPPCVVKPNDADNSYGVSLVRSLKEFSAALEAAFAHSDTVLVEDYVELGREVRCGIVERDGTLQVLPLEEYFVHANERPIRSDQHKLNRDDTGKLKLAAKEITEAWIVGAHDVIVKPVAEAAQRCHRALGCRHYSLFDFRIDPAGQPWFLEAGLYCSFAPQSVIVTMMAAAGTPLDRFFADAIAQAIA